MRITKRQLKRIIREGFTSSTASRTRRAGAMPLVGAGALGRNPMSSRPRRQSLNESAYLHDILSDAADALDRRDTDTLERILARFDDMLIGADEAMGYKEALRSMIDAAYELLEYENEDGYTAEDY